jgi:MFS family permease
MALSVLYEEADSLSVRFDGKSITEIFTEEEFTSIRTDDDTDRYNTYVVPLRQSYAVSKTAASPLPVILFAVILLFTLIAMGTFRSPAVALMPDVTPRPLRSKANAIINLMGAFGGILVLGLGIIFGTGSVKNTFMSFTTFFGIVAAIMIISLMIFLWKVKEPKLLVAMKEESRALGISEEEEDPASPEEKSGGKLSPAALRSLLLILASVVLWFMGYNAVTSKYSVYAGSVLSLDYNATLIIAQAAAIVTYVPVGIIASKVGRKKTVLCGVAMLALAFFIGVFVTPTTPPALMYPIFILAGIGWATINVNSFPMAIELAKKGDIGKYTGYYYTASMAAQILAPILSGVLYDLFGMRYTFFSFGAFFVVLSYITMSLVKHGDSIPLDKKSLLEHLDVD